jgi:hypothetical protein
MKRSTRFPVVGPSPDISYRYPCAFGYMFVCEFNVCSKLYYYTRNYSVCEVDSLAGNVDPSTGTWVQDFFSSILSIKCASTTYMNPFDMFRCEINGFMNYAPFS